jgi:nucleoside-diphosphate-sugar epimerase
MKILVTGGTGFVGGHLIGELLADGRNQVCALVRDSGKLETCAFKDRVSVLRGDLFASEPFPDDIELVFHLAAVTKAVSKREFTRVNIDGTRALLARLRPLKNLKKVVLLSSQAAAGPSRSPDPVREETPAEPISLYGRSKLGQEEILAAHCPVPHVIVRAPIVFGPGDMDMLDAFRIVNRGIIPILGRGERRYSVIYVKDLVRGMVAAAFSPCGNETYYIANPEAIEWRSFMEQVARLLGRKNVRRIRVPEFCGRILAEFSELRIRAFGNKAIFNRDKFNEMKFPAWVCSAAKIEAQLHFQPRIPLAAALEETIAWYRERDLL